ncbi:MAG: MBL fold metallo-hydrolase [Clostridia bacterium]|nr:MBL fold metallo-hydrolase [Clostridia bacterium]
MSIKINAHSSIFIAEKNKKIFVDPFMIKDGKNQADYIFITHSHYDHFSPEDILKVANKKTIFVAPVSLKSEILRLNVKEENLYLVFPNDIVVLEGFKAIAIPSYNLKEKFHEKESKFVGYLFDFFTTKVYVAGDTDYIPEMKEIKCDIALVPIGGKYTMDYKDASQFINDVKPKIAIPTHYGSIVGKITDGIDFKNSVDKSVQVKLLIGDN